MAGRDAHAEAALVQAFLTNTNPLDSSTQAVYFRDDATLITQ